MIFRTKKMWSIFFKGNMNAKLVTEVLSSKLNKNYLQQQNYSSIDNDSKHKNLYAYDSTKK